MGKEPDLDRGAAEIEYGASDNDISFICSFVWAALVRSVEEIGVRDESFRGVLGEEGESREHIDVW